VQYFFQFRIQEQIKTLALVSIFSAPNLDLLRDSYQTVWSCRYQAEVGYRVIDATTILSVVAMIPEGEGEETWYFLVEKPGLDMGYLGGYEQDEDGDGYTEE
jgi:hypothetical protein